MTKIVDNQGKLREKYFVHIFYTMTFNLNNSHIYMIVYKSQSKHIEYRAHLMKWK